jgi:lipoprotein-releasing system permease protein
MYKLLLCWRYLLTRYLALACIVSVMLGVGTLIVVNSVMSGFSTKLKDRLHGLLSDIVIESLVQDGFADPEGKMEKIRNSRIGPKIEAMTATIEKIGVIGITFRGESMTPRPIRLIGVNARERAAMPGFAEFLTDPRIRQQPSFERTPEAEKYHREHYRQPEGLELPAPPREPGKPPPPKMDILERPKEFYGVMPGWALGTLRVPDSTVECGYKDWEILQPGDEVVIYTLTSEGEGIRPVYDSLVVTTFVKTEMSEYDSQYVYVPLEWLQKACNMENRATHIQIKLNDYKDAKEVVEELRTMFPTDFGYHVDTWEDKQGSLLAAISIERGILNVLLFLIVGVAGFGILAIFSMIVVEKTKDIGILKALGASNGGVMNIFLGYGFLLGAIGALLGTVLGLAFTWNINDVEKFITRITGQEVFPRHVYYFDAIPTNIQATTVCLIVFGAVLIAVGASILPALRAALLHPVRALRYE